MKKYNKFAWESASLQRLDKNNLIQLFLTNNRPIL